MGANRPNDYFTVVEQARGLELQYHLTEVEATRTSTGSDRKRSYLGERGSTQQSDLKKSKIDHDYLKSSLAPNARTDLGPGLVCYKCGENHRAAECDFSGTCDYCSKTEHRSIVCRRNPNSIINWKKGNSSSRDSLAAKYEANPSRFSNASVQMMSTPPFVQTQYTPLPPGYYWSATPLPASHVPLALPTPRLVPQQPQQFPGAYSTPIPSGDYMASKTPSRADAPSGTPFGLCPLLVLPITVQLITSYRLCLKGNVSRKKKARLSFFVGLTL